MCSSTFEARRMDSMRKQWVTAVVMVALALALTVPAWADCKVQMVLTSSVLGASGTAEKKVTATTLKSPAVNKFEVDVHAAPLTPYLVMVSSGREVLHLRREPAGALCCTWTGSVRRNAATSSSISAPFTSSIGPSFEMKDTRRLSRV